MHLKRPFYDRIVSKTSFLTGRAVACIFSNTCRESLEKNANHSTFFSQWVSEVWPLGINNRQDSSIKIVSQKNLLIKGGRRFTIASFKAHFTN